MNGPLISVIVPVYKSETWLPQCVESILKQSYENLELILVDDGSPDRSGSLCDRYAAQDARVRVIHQQNAGASAARNAGLDIARGAYITFADSDDWAEPDWLAALLQPLEDDPGAQVSVCGWVRREATKEEDCSGRLDLPPLDGDEAFALAALNVLEGYLWNKLFRAELIGSRRLRTDVSVCEDLLFSCTLFLDCTRVLCVPRPLYNYRIWLGSCAHEVTRRLESEDIAREAIIDMAQGSRRREEAAVFSYVQLTWLNVQRAKKIGDPRGEELRKKVMARAPQALSARSVPLQSRVRLALKMGFPFLISKKYLE